MKRHFLLLGLCGLMALGWSPSATAIDKATYDRAIDYLNCRIAELSVKDQPGQPHLAAFAEQTQRCDLDAFRGDFYKTLQAFYAQRPLAKSQQLAAFIQAFKTRHRPDYDSKQLFRYVVDTLMKEAPIETFAQRHAVTYPAVQSDLSSYIYNLFTNAEPAAPIDENDALTGRDRTFGNDTADTYIHQDGGNANDELIVEEDPKPATSSDLYDNAIKPWWYTLRWLLAAVVLSLLLLALAWRFKWWQRIENQITRRQLSPEQAAAFQQLQHKIAEVEAQNVSLQEEVSMLRQRILSHEQKNNAQFEDAEYEVIDDPDAQKSSFTWVSETESTSEIPQAVDLENLTTGNQFFMPIPNAQGEFDGTKANTSFQRLQSAYKFTVTDSDGQQAHFQLVDDIATMVRALENYDEYIRPACRTTMIPPKIATRVITEEPGLAIRDGKEWHLVSKAVIRCV